MPKIPPSLQIIAWLFLLSGIAALIGLIVQISSGTILFDTGLLGIPTYFGLRRLSPGWRKYAMLCLLLGVVVWPAGIAFGLLSKSPAHVAILGVRVGDISAPSLVAVSATMLVLAVWQVRTLTRPDIRALFINRAGVRPV